VYVLKLPLISVVIPAFNEELSLGSVIDDAKSMLRNMGLPHEIIVVNDGSRDRTADVAKNYGAVLINNRRNLGKGAALINGFVKARGDVIVAMDADGSHSADDIPKLVYPILKNGSTKVTIGSRFTYDFGKRSTSSLHLVGNKIINFIILCLTGKYISDSQCGFRAYRREVLRKIALHSSGFDIESEMIIKLLKNGWDVKEVPIVCYPRRNGLTRIDTFKDGFNIVKGIIKATFYSVLG
jgi:glycosyltransferase involved in cell wall biosynthesis